MLKIVGYPDRYSVAPGEKIAFKVSLEEGTHFEARLVRVIHGDCNPEGPGLKFRHVKTGIDGRHKGRPQRIDAGSYMKVDAFPPLTLGAFTFFAMIWPTLLKRPGQTLLAQWDAANQSGFRIEMTEGGELGVVLGDGSGRVAELKSGKKMLERQWYSIAVAIDPETQSVTLDQRPLQPYSGIEDRAQATARLALAPKAVATPLLIAGCPLSDGTVGRHFDGKIDGPLLLSGLHPADHHEAYLRTPLDPALLRHIIAKWDFSKDIPTTQVVDAGPSRHHARSCICRRAA